MKRLKLIGIVACMALFVAACSSDKKAETISDSGLMDSMATDTSVTTTRQTETTESNIDDEGATFMKKAAVGGMMEVEAGKAAAINASSQAVKDFAALMVKDHTMAGNELKDLAAQKKIMLPAGLPDAEQMHITEMKKMTGKAFDTHYMDMMVADHAKTVALFKDATMNKDPDVKGWAEKTLKVIEGHYEMAKKIKSGK